MCPSHDSSQALSSQVTVLTLPISYYIFWVWHCTVLFYGLYHSWCPSLHPVQYFSLLKANLKQANPIIHDRAEYWVLVQVSVHKAGSDLFYSCSQSRPFTQASELLPQLQVVELREIICSVISIAIIFWDTVPGTASTSSASGMEQSMQPRKVQCLVPLGWQLLKLQASIQCAPDFSTEIHFVLVKLLLAHGRNTIVSMNQRFSSSCKGLKLLPFKTSCAILSFCCISRAIISHCHPY